MANFRRQFVPYRNRPKCFFDFETTHIDLDVAEITEIGFVHELKGKWSIRVMPEHLELASEEALNIGHFNERDWSGAPGLRDVWPKVVEYMEDVILIGHNASGFDMPVLRSESKRKGLSMEGISRAVIDTQVLALQMLIPKGQLKQIGLGALCDHYDVSNEGAHFALEDAMRCQKVYYAMTNGQQEMF
jgi:DNA polymerase III alpha subunit (gram-positive type)